MTVLTVHKTGERSAQLEKTSEFLHRVERFLMQKTHSGYVVWFEPTQYDKKDAHEFDGETFYGTIYVTRQNAEGQFVVFE